MPCYATTHNQLLQLMLLDLDLVPSLSSHCLALFLAQSALMLFVLVKIECGSLFFPKQPRLVREKRIFLAFFRGTKKEKEIERRTNEL